MTEKGAFNPKGIAFLCTATGQVQRVLNTGYPLDRIPQPGESAMAAVDPVDADKAERFFRQLSESGVCSGWEMAVRAGGQLVTCWFSAMTEGDSMLVLLAGDGMALRAFARELSSGQGLGLDETQRVMAGVLARAPSLAGLEPERDLDALTRLNNELANLQREVAKKNAQLEATNRNLSQALAEVKELRGLLPICAQCKKVRDDQNYWHHIESYISQHTHAQFSHGLCPECYQEYMQEVERFTEGLDPNL